MTRADQRRITPRPSLRMSMVLLSANRCHLLTIDRLAAWPEQPLSRLGLTPS
jgi:hypothetical protein